MLSSRPDWESANPRRRQLSGATGPQRTPIWVFTGILAGLSTVIAAVLASRTSSEVSLAAQFGIDAVIVFGLLLVGSLALFVYFLPTYRAFRNQKRLGAIIAILNVFFGWTMFGWWLLLAWGNTPEECDYRPHRRDE